MQEVPACNSNESKNKNANNDNSSLQEHESSTRTQSTVADAAVLAAHGGVGQYTTMMLVHFYRRFNSSKVKDVNIVVKQFRGRDIELFEKLSRKYGQPDPMKSLPTFYSYIDGVHAHHRGSLSTAIRRHRYVSYKKTKFAFLQSDDGLVPVARSVDSATATNIRPSGANPTMILGSPRRSVMGFVPKMGDRGLYDSLLTVPTPEVMGLMPESTHNAALSRGFAAWMGKPSISLFRPPSPDIVSRGEDMNTLPVPASPLRRRSEGGFAASSPPLGITTTTATVRVTLQGCLLPVLCRYRDAQKQRQREPPPHFILITTVWQKQEGSPDIVVCHQYHTISVVGHLANILNIEGGTDDGEWSDTFYIFGIPCTADFHDEIELQFVLVMADATTGIQIPLHSHPVTPVVPKTEELFRTAALSRPKASKAASNLSTEESTCATMPTPCPAQSPCDSFNRLSSRMPSQYRANFPGTHTYAYAPGAPYAKESGYLHSLTSDQEESLTILKRSIPEAGISIERGVHEAEGLSPLLIWPFNVSKILF
jgi:hypothetical protein